MTTHAEWKFDGGSDAYDSYIDYSRIKTEGRYKSMWVLKDYKSPQTEATGKQYKSAITKVLIDCKASRNQNVALYFYSEQMGGGQLIYSGNYSIKESDWEYSPPNSFGDGYIKVACGRK